MTTRNPLLRFLPSAVALVALSLIVGCNLDFTDSDDEPTADQIASAEQTEQQAAAAPTSTGFLWKPVSESDGNLVILLPNALRGKVNGCTVIYSGGSEAGRFAGDTHNGDRPHYRFSKSGAAYGQNITVVASLTAGGDETWSIPNGAERTTY